MSSPAIANVECQSCKHSFTFPYRLLGCSHRCPGCSRWTVPTVPLGSHYPASGVELQYSDFLGLISEKEVQTQLTEWFNYSVIGDGAACQIINREREVIDPLWVHQRIQDDATLTGKMYNIAMTIWHS